MATLKIEIDLDNLAFEYQGEEAARILRDLADKIDGCVDLSNTRGVLHDYNGNATGAVYVEQQS